MRAMDSLPSFLILGSAIRRDHIVYAQGDSGRLVGNTETIQKRRSRRSEREMRSVAPHFPQPNFWGVSEISTCLMSSFYKSGTLVGEIR
jgi:hypothetical protein